MVQGVGDGVSANSCSVNDINLAFAGRMQELHNILTMLLLVPMTMILVKLL